MNERNEAFPTGLTVFFFGAYVFDLELQAAVFENVVPDGVGDVERPFGLDISCRGTLSEGYSVDDVVGIGINQFQFDVFLLATHYLAGAEIVDILRTEQRLGIAGTKRREAF